MGYPLELLAPQWKRVLPEHSHSPCSQAGWFRASRVAAMLSLSSYMCCKGTGMNGAFGSQRRRACGLAPVLELHARRDQRKVHARREGCFAVHNLCSPRLLDSNGLFGSSPGKSCQGWQRTAGIVFLDPTATCTKFTEGWRRTSWFGQCLNDLCSALKPCTKQRKLMCL